MKYQKQLVVCLILLLMVVTPLLVMSLHAGADTTTTTELESVASDGTLPNGKNSNSIVSPDGRYVYFMSLASNLVPNDTNNSADIFVHDRLTNTTTMLDVNNSGEEANLGVVSFDISDGGRYLVYSSHSSNIVTSLPDSTNNLFIRDLATGQTSLLYSSYVNSINSNNPAISGDGNWITFETYIPSTDGTYTNIYLINRETHALTRISNGIDGAMPNSGSNSPDIDFDGSSIVFYSSATNLVNSDTNGQADVFLWNKNTNSISRISVSSSGAQANNYSEWPKISENGEGVVFASYATNLASNATINGQFKIFLHQLDSGTTSLIDVTPTGQESNVAPTPQSGRISGDGEYVIFSSAASDLVADDTNGLSDVFLRDTQAGTTSRVSLDSSGNQLSSGSGADSISTDGQFITFSSYYGLSVAGTYLRY